MFKLIANTTPAGIFGTVEAPVPALSDTFGGISRLFVVGLQLFFSVAAIAVLIYLLWGAFDWVTSGGDPDKIGAAQAKMTHAVLGLILVIVALTIFFVVAGNILGIVTRDNNGNWIFKLPSIRNSCTSAGCECSTSGAPCDAGLSCVPKLDGSGKLTCQ